MYAYYLNLLQSTQPLQGTQYVVVVAGYAVYVGRCRVRGVYGRCKVRSRCRVRGALVVAGYAVYVGRCRVRGVQLSYCQRPQARGTKVWPRCVVEIRFLKLPILNRTSQPADRPLKPGTRARV
jgi:hypothetical protein